MQRTADSPAAPLCGILLVEDNPGDALLIREILSEPNSLRVEIVQARTWARAMELLSTSPFDVVLLDLNLPDSSGLATVKRALTSVRDIPIVVLTGCDDESTALAAVQAGAQDYQVKGRVEGTTLACTLRYAVERHQLIRELREAREREHHLATHDCLTGLANRHLFFDRLSQSVRYAARYPSKVGVLFVDLDGFKVINDGLGHPRGDEVLVEVGRRLRTSVRESDTVARLGGDEFAVLLNEVAGKDVERIVETLLDQLREPIRLPRAQVQVRASIGIALHPGDGTSAQALVQNADAAMYQAKAAGGDRYHFCTNRIRSVIEERSAVASSMEGGLARGEFTVFYQPQVRAGQWDLIGFEALTRWRHPLLGLILPDQFIPVAEQNGLIMPLGEWVLKSACQQLRKWQDSGAAELRMAVNVSHRQIQQGDLPQRTAAILQDCAIDADKLTLEITESCLVNDVEGTASSLLKLKELGVRISVDDFGAGYSSLIAIRHFPVDALKLDRSFVQGVETDPRAEAIAKATIDLARGLGLELIAEGIETFEQAEFLLARQCTHMQGYLFGRPLPPEELTASLSRIGSRRDDRLIAGG